MACIYANKWIVHINIMRVYLYIIQSAFGKKENGGRLTRTLYVNEPRSRPVDNRPRVHDRPQAQMLRRTARITRDAANHELVLFYVTGYGGLSNCR